MNQKEAYKNSVKRVSSLLRKIDEREIVNKKELRLFTIVRNESLRLPHFFKYYKEKGVERFFIIDNDSSDESVRISLQQTNTHVFSITEPYKNHWLWMEYMLDVYGKNNWCLVVDCDELICYPFEEYLTIKRLAKFLEVNNYTAMRFLLLDMYSEKPIKDVGYIQGEDPLKYCNYFDDKFDKKKVIQFDKNKWEPFTSLVFTGGMRTRVFGTDLPTSIKQQYDRLPYNLSKISLFRHSDATYLTQGMHTINGAILTNIMGVVFHTKFMQDFIYKLEDEIRREQYFGGAIMYKIFHHKVLQNEMLSLKGCGSKKFNNWQQFLELNLMYSTKKLERFAIKSQKLRTKQMNQDKKSRVNLNNKNDKKI